MSETPKVIEAPLPSAAVDPLVCDFCEEGVEPMAKAILFPVSDYLICARCLDVCMETLEKAKVIEDKP